MSTPDNTLARIIRAFVLIILPAWALGIRRRCCHLPDAAMKTRRDRIRHTPVGYQRRPIWKWLEEEPSDLAIAGLLALAGSVILVACWHAN